ncbi:MAG: hypothetical protein M1548_03430 [Actinobacteria bacterium]|nr:hypothetical protein [Actinomycetota bacterium]
MSDLKDEFSSDGGFVDIHAHILPGLDDGAVAVEESVEMARTAVAHGVSAIIATPHSNEAYGTDRAVVEREIASLNKVLRSEGVELEVYPGAEIKASPHIFRQLEDGSLQTLADSRYILIEMPLDDIPFYMQDLIFRLRLKGLVPILAHPERTVAVQKRLKRLESLVDQGCLIQINTLSLEMGFGPEYATAVDIMRKGWAFAVASDAHDLESRPPCLKGALHIVARLLGKSPALALVRDNPGRILGFFYPSFTSLG